MKTIEDIWFGAVEGQESTPTKSAGPADTSPMSGKAQLLAKVSVIMGVSSQFRDRQSPLEDLLHKVSTLLSLSTHHAHYVAGYCG